MAAMMATTETPRSAAATTPAAGTARTARASEATTAMVMMMMTATESTTATHWHAPAPAAKSSNRADRRPAHPAAHHAPAMTAAVAHERHAGSHFMRRW
ncbi:hypothetical protein BP00DRAFT_426010 [Aspergillus indologenus CBS 114.80]|uniref:Uncharacterized protein n=1 Tax=Aspergillus indologenus CBS 114.80 TaxID=1450541 RepID=A0A2V5I2I3_9EURO|nr:hypothetical protein BP00DRAFT_426010 [Aspergillus indologenus CBS 114.80]